MQMARDIAIHQDSFTHSSALCQFYRVQQRAACHLTPIETEVNRRKIDVRDGHSIKGCDPTRRKAAPMEYFVT